MYNLFWSVRLVYKYMLTIYFLVFLPRWKEFTQTFIYDLVLIVLETLMQCGTFLTTIINLAMIPFVHPPYVLICSNSYFSAHVLYFFQVLLRWISWSCIYFAKDYYGILCHFFFATNPAGVSSSSLKLVLLLLQLLVSLFGSGEVRVRPEHHPPGAGRQRWPQWPTTTPRHPPSPPAHTRDGARKEWCIRGAIWVWGEQN
jgi:hypothetical protein